MKQIISRYTTGMVFGVFDGLHAGHKYFITEASKRCKKLLVVVTPDHIVHLLKGHLPHHTYEERVATLQTFDQTLNIVPGDTQLGEWSVLQKHSPQIVFLGHDQHPIADELEKRRQPFAWLEAHLPEKHKSSLLFKREASRSLFQGE